MSSQRVQSWIWGALNPLIDALETEVTFLSRGDLTWSYRQRGPEILRPPKKYLLSGGQIVLEDLQRSGKADLRQLEWHGHALEDAWDAAQKAFSALVASEPFKQAARKWMNAHEQAASSPPWPKDDAGREQYVCQIAEYLVNNRRTLPGNYTDAEFWKGAAEPLLAEFEPLLKDTCEKTRAARDDAERVVEALKNIRFTLCEQYDVPAAPVAGLAM